MAEEKKQEKQKPKEQKHEKPQKHSQELELTESLVRILGYDIPGSKNLYTGLTRIKGVSWSIANITCLKLEIPHSKKISELSKEEIQKIENFLENPEMKDYLKNHRFMPETGETKHLVATDLDMTRDFDIRRLKKIKSYRGVRHSFGLPVRGQRTRSHFRKKSGSTGIKRKTEAVKAAAK